MYFEFGSDVEILEYRRFKECGESFYEHGCEGTNLKIVQNYLDFVPKEEIRLLGLKQWANCNTREDYKKIRKRWDEEER